MPPGVSFFPPPGAYDLAQIDPASGFPVALRTDHPSGAIFYRLAPDAAWEPYQIPLALFADATFEAYAGIPFAGEVSPVASGQFTFSTQPALAVRSDTDLDGDGLGDAWEKAFGVSDAGGDIDEDGAIHLEEHNAGTDPRDPSSVPLSSGERLLQARTEPDGAGGTLVVLSWADSLIDVQLQTSLNVVDWTTVTSGITQAGGFFEWRTPVATRMFFRLAR